MQFRVTNEKELETMFIGIMIEIYDPSGNSYSVPGWQCKRCGWQIGSLGYPPGHTCPDDGEKQERIDE